MSSTYITKQQRAVLSCIEQCPGSRATAMALTEELHRQGQPVGLSTVYRQLENLSRQGLVHKIVTDNGACYQYCDGRSHKDCFLLQCEKCGTIYHMDCSHLGELYDHLLTGHGFAINPRRTVFYGLCRKCREAEQ